MNIGIELKFHNFISKHVREFRVLTGRDKELGQNNEPCRGNEKNH
jgi:hypothetical protein